MKKLILGLTVLFSYTSIMAKTACQDVTSVTNTHTQLSCPDVKKVCLLNSKMIVFENSMKVQKTYSISERYVQHMSDVGSQILAQVAIEDGIGLVEFNSDNGYPRPIEGQGIAHLSIWTQKTNSQKSVYPSQGCFYDLKQLK